MANLVLVPAGRDVEIKAESPEQQHATILWEGREQHFDIVGILDFTQDILTATRQHAAQQSFWETLAAEITSRINEFELVGYAKWWAHARRYARYVLGCLGTKETLESLNDQVIQIFSEEVLSDPEEMDRYAYLATQGLLVERTGSKAAATRYFEALSEQDKVALQVSTREHMFAYSRTGYTYEEITRTYLRLKEQKEKVQGLAKAMEKRSYKINEYAGLTGMKHGNSRMDDSAPVERPYSSTPVLPPARGVPSVPVNGVSNVPTVPLTPVMPAATVPVSVAAQMGLPAPVPLVPAPPTPVAAPVVQSAVTHSVVSPVPVPIQAPALGVLPQTPPAPVPSATPALDALMAMSMPTHAPVATGAPPWVAGPPAVLPKVAQPAHANGVGTNGFMPVNGAGKRGYEDDVAVPGGDSKLLGSMPRGRGRSTSGPSW